MKITMARGELFDALSVAARGMSSRSTLPILSGILISASSDGSVSFQATDLEVSIKTTRLGAVEGSGESVLPGKLLTDIVRSLPEAAVTISIDNDVAAVTCGQASFTLKTLPPEDFPKFPEIEVSRSIELDVSALSDTASHVSRAVSRDETRPILTGVLMAVEGPVLKMVATDSYRLAIKEINLGEAHTEDLEVVVPGKALDEAVKLATGSKTMTMGISDNQAVFSAGTTVFVTRRIEGSFPNYKQLVPKETETKAMLDAKEFLAAVKRVSLMAQHNTPLKVSVSSEDQTVSLSATTQDVGDASEDLMASVIGQDVEIAFNHAFLTDGITSAAGDKVTLETVSSLKPGVLTSEGDDGFLYLLMPVRLG